MHRRTSFFVLFVLCFLPRLIWHSRRLFHCLCFRSQFGKSHIYIGDRLSMGRARYWTTQLNDAPRGSKRLFDRLVWERLDQQGWRSDGETVCSDLMVSSVVKRLRLCPGPPWPASVYPIWTLRGVSDCLISKGSVTLFLLLLFAHISWQLGRGVRVSCLQMEQFS